MSELTELEMPGGPIKPCIIVDQSEKKPLVFTRLPSKVAHLPTGDYSIVGAETAFAIERKAIPDLICSAAGCERERFERGLQRLRAYQFRRLLIVGEQRHLTKNAWHFLLDAEVRFDVPVVWIYNAEQAAIQVERWAMWWAQCFLSSAQQLVTAIKQGDSSASRSSEETVLPSPSPTSIGHGLTVRQPCLA